MQAKEHTLSSIFFGWSALQTLTLESMQLGTSAATCLPRCSLPGLESLYLTKVKLRREADAGLAQAHLPQLRTLSISDNDLDFYALTHVAKGQWPYLSTLSVNRSRHEMTVGSIIDPLEGSNWPLLEHLSALGWGFMRVFDHSSGHCRWPKLTSLAVSYISGQSGSMLPNVQSIELSEVTWLGCIGNLLDIQLPALQKLVLHPYKRNFCVHVKMSQLVNNAPVLSELVLPGQRLGESSFAPLLQAKWSLCILDLSHNCVSPAAMEYIAACDWPSLRELSLAGNKLDHSGIYHLVCGKWSALESLDLSGNKLDDLAVQHLVKGEWPYLKTLDLSSHNSACGFAVNVLLQGKWPRVELLYLYNHCDSILVYDALLCVKSDGLKGCMFATLLQFWFNESMKAMTYGDDFIKLSWICHGVSFDTFKNFSARSGYSCIQSQD